MNLYYKTFLENKLLKSNGAEFQALFYKIMRYYYKEKFMEIKPYGNIGDRKCDGYVRKEGIFFQVYGPEEPNKRETISYAKGKLIKDFDGLYAHTQNNHYEIIKVLVQYRQCFLTN